MHWVYKFKLLCHKKQNTSYLATEKHKSYQINPKWCYANWCLYCFSVWYSFPAGWKIWCNLCSISWSLFSVAALLSLHFMRYFSVVSWVHCELQPNHHHSKLHNSQSQLTSSVTEQPSVEGISTNASVSQHCFITAQYIILHEEINCGQTCSAVLRKGIPELFFALQ